MQFPPVADPGPDVSKAPALLAVAGVMLFLVLLTYALRMWARARPTPRFGWDDLTISVCIPCAIVGYALIVAMCAAGYGRKAFYLTPDAIIWTAKLGYLRVVPVWVVSCAFSKISIACMLLRIRRERKWRIFLYVMIGIQVAWLVGMIVVGMTQCDPVQATWNRLGYPDAWCRSEVGVQVAIIIPTMVTILTDLILALIPISFIVKLQRPLREKIVLGCLMGMGLFVIGASIAKTVMVQKFVMTTDPTYGTTDTVLWNVLEDNISIIAANLPTLKHWFEKVLRHVGLLSTQPRPSGGSNYWSVPPHQSYRLTARGRSQKLGADVDAQSEENILPSDHVSVDKDGILKATVTTKVEPIAAEDSWKSDGEAEIGVSVLRS